jgi:hypothetical protein
LSIQLRKTTFAIKDSTTIILPQWFTTLEELMLCQQMMSHNVTTRWNSTYDMLEFTIKYREALESITGNQRMKLRQYELTEEDWNIATQLHDILKVHYYALLFNHRLSFPQQIFKDATLFFLCDTPNIAMVIPAMDHLDKHLTNAALNPKYPMSIKATIAIGKKTLNRYYDKTDHSEVFRIAIDIVSFIILFLSLTNFLS